MKKIVVTLAFFVLSLVLVAAFWPVQLPILVCERQERYPFDWSGEEHFEGVEDVFIYPFADAYGEWLVERMQERGGEWYIVGKWVGPKSWVRNGDPVERFVFVPRLVSEPWPNWGLATVYANHIEESVYRPYIVWYTGHSQVPAAKWLWMTLFYRCPQ